MQLNLRQAIIQRVQDKSNDELNQVIESSVGSEERALPGLGVLFEMIWSEIDQPTKDQLSGYLKNHLDNNYAGIPTETNS